MCNLKKQKKNYKNNVFECWIDIPSRYHDPSTAEYCNPAINKRMDGKPTCKLRKEYANIKEFTKKEGGK